MLWTLLLLFTPQVRVRGGGFAVESVPSLILTRPTLTSTAPNRMPCSRQPLGPEEALNVRAGYLLEPPYEYIRTETRVGQQVQPTQPLPSFVLPLSGHPREKSRSKSPKAIERTKVACVAAAGAAKLCFACEGQTFNLIVLKVKGCTRAFLRPR